MKSGKSKLITILFSFILCIGALSFGVYAAVSATLSASGTVTFNAHGIDVDVDGNITGAIGTGITTTYSGTTNKTRQPSKNLISSTPWAFGNLVFDESKAIIVTDMEIRIEIKISNFSNFPIEASITVPSVSGLTITKQDINYLYKYYKSTEADTQNIIVTICPNSWETPVNLGNLYLTLNITKAIKQETAITKFKWSTAGNGKIGITGNYLLDTDTDIIIPRQNNNNKVDSIGVSAFTGKTLVKSLIIPSFLTSIGDNAFINCTSLDTITIPSSVTSIGNNSFSNTAWYTIQQTGIVYVGNVIYKYKGTVPSTISNIKKDTVAIADSVFSNCHSLESIIIPASVTKIGNGSFYYCSKLSNVVISPNVTSIGERAFSNCISLTNITIPSSVTKIGLNAFEGCSVLTNINIPNGVTSIENYTFRNCSALVSIIIPENISTIGRGTFIGCIALDTVYFERRTGFVALGYDCFSELKNGSVLYFKNETVMNQFVAGTHYLAANTTKALY